MNSQRGIITNHRVELHDILIPFCGGGCEQTRTVVLVGVRERRDLKDGNEEVKRGEN